MRKNKSIWLVATASVLIAGSTSSIYAQQNLIHIYPPASQVVRPGQTLIISVAADSSVHKLALIGQQPIGMARLAVGGAAGMVAQGQGRPIEFQLTIPSAIQPGIYHLTAVGRAAANPVESDPLLIDVEIPEEPARIWAEPSTLQFSRVGDQIPLRILGSFADGAQSELTRSRKTSFASADPRVASISPDGLVTAVTAGKTTILVRTPSLDYSIPVRVQENE
jgi:hypothetical protein